MNESKRYGDNTKLFAEKEIEASLCSATWSQVWSSDLSPFDLTYLQNFRRLQREAAIRLCCLFVATLLSSPSVMNNILVSNSFEHEMSPEDPYSTFRTAFEVQKSEIERLQNRVSELEKVNTEVLSYVKRRGSLPVLVILCPMHSFISELF